MYIYIYIHIYIRIYVCICVYIRRRVLYRCGSHPFFHRCGSYIWEGHAHPCDCRQFWHANKMWIFKNDESYQDGDPDPPDPCDGWHFWNANKTWNLKSDDNYEDGHPDPPYPCECRQLWHANKMWNLKNDDSYEDVDLDPPNPCDCWRVWHAKKVRAEVFFLCERRLFLFSVTWKLPQLKLLEGYVYCKYIAKYSTGKSWKATNVAFFCSRCNYKKNIQKKETW